jgi:hypothetical protein
MLLSGAGHQSHDRKGVAGGALTLRGLKDMSCRFGQTPDNDTILLMEGGDSL